ncbi:MAG: nuclear transport factor 2 family protein [Candidatus Omnitrophica bacterium]|nr:nuclear transport factor 2 family protein [Candidatus Omnitrophota bacterium]
MTPRRDDSKEESAIQKQVDAFVAAWNRHDTKSMANVYTEDADLINPNGRIAKSRTEIEQLFRDEHAGPFKQSQFSATPESTRLLTPALAVTTQAFEVTGAIDPSGNRITLRGHFTNVMKKQDATWQVLVCRAAIPASPEPR